MLSSFSSTTSSRSFLPDAEHGDDEEAAKPPAAQPQWRQENREPWQLHSELGPNVDAEGGRAAGLLMPELVNPRDHDWSSPLWPEFSHRTACEFWERLKSADEQYSDESLDMQALNDDDQMLFVRLVLDHAKRIVDCAKAGRQPQPMRILLLGTAGSGKTRATQTVLQELQRFLSDVGLSDVLEPATFFRVAAPSGSAAFNIRFGASTVHSLIHWFNIRRFAPITDEKKLFDLQEKFRSTFFVFFDECSMIGRQMLGRIDSRLRQAKGVTASLGGLSVVAVGDPGQCEAICDQQMYDVRPHPGTVDGSEAASLSNVGLDLWQTFDEVVVLTAVHRLRTIDQPTTEADREYNACALRWVKFLRRVRDADISLEDYYWLCDRKRSKLSLAERSEFNSAPVIMDFRRSTEANVEDNCEFYNAKHLRYHAKKEGVPVVRFDSVHEGIEEKDGEKLDDHRFGNTPAVLETSKGARMLLTRNLAVSAGLINGTRLEVVDVLYGPGKHPNHAFKAARLPDCIVCNAPHYRGEPYFDVSEHPERATWLPFLPRTARDENNSAVSRLQFPLTLAWALTPQKAQGMTLDKAIVNCKQVTNPGVLFVSLSRVRHYFDVMLEDDFPALSRILKLRNAPGHRLRLAWEKKMLARFGETVRRHRRDPTLYDSERCWTSEESSLAERILAWVKRNPTAVEQEALGDVLRFSGFMTDVEPDVDVCLLERVAAKLSRFPHCHELEVAASARSVALEPSLPTAVRRVSFRDWEVPVEDLRLARDTGELSAAAFELFARVCRSRLPGQVTLASPFVCQAEKLRRHMALHTGCTLCYPFRTSTSHIWSCYVVVASCADDARVWCLRPAQAPAAAFDSTDALFRRVTKVASVQVVDANLASSQDVLLLPRLLQFLAQERILAEGCACDDDVVISRYCAFLTATLASVAEGASTVEAVFGKRSDVSDAFQDMFFSASPTAGARKRGLQTVTSRAPPQKLGRLDLPSVPESTTAAPSTSSSATVPAPRAAPLRLPSAVKLPSLPSRPTPPPPPPQRDASRKRPREDRLELEASSERPASSAAASSVPASLSVAAASAQRPRAFRNLGNSCYVNATLIALFGLGSLRRVLRGLWDRTSPSQRDALRAVVLGAEGSEAARPRETDFARCSDDVRLAVIFHVCCEPPRAEPLIPCLLTDRYYRAAQEDAHEFLCTAFLRSLDGDLARLFRGRQRYYLRCRGCGHLCVHGSTDPFTVVQLPVVAADGSQQFSSVQAAMDCHLEPELLDAAFHFRCESCGSTEPPARYMRFAEHPQVLAIQLKRWNPGNLHEPYAHVVVPDAQLTVTGTRYALAGFVCHIGNRIRFGHYTAVMRNPDATNEWWFYDDSLVMLAKDEHRRTQPGKKLYIAFYEREAVAAASASGPHDPSESHAVVGPQGMPQPQPPRPSPASSGHGAQVSSASGASRDTSGVQHEPTSSSRIAGFSSTGGISHDVFGEQAQWERTAMARFRERDAEGQRGRRVDLWGNDIDLGSGAVSLQPRRSQAPRQDPPGQ